MADRRELATVNDYDSLRSVLRDRIAELRISYENLDDVAGFQSNYAGKLTPRRRPRYARRNADGG